MLKINVELYRQSKLINGMSALERSIAEFTGDQSACLGKLQREAPQN